MTAPTDGGMSVGSVGGGAVVLQGQNLTNLNLRFDLADVGDVAQAQALIDDVRAKLGVRAAFGTTMRRLEPAVLVNRKAELDKLSELLNSGVPIVVVTGVAGVGKSSLARAALELRPADVPVIWFAAESTRVGDIATRIDEVCGLGLDLGPDPARSTGAVLARLQQPLILVVDGVEALLDDDFALLDPEYAAFFETIAETEHPARLILTGRVSPLELDGHPQARVLALKGISAIAAETLLVTSSDVEGRHGGVPPTRSDRPAERQPEADHPAGGLAGQPAARADRGESARSERHRSLSHPGGDLAAGRRRAGAGGHRRADARDVLRRRPARVA